MRNERLKELLEEVASGVMSPEGALERLRYFPVENLSHSRVDHARPLIQGHPEVVFCEGKTPSQVVEICEALERANGCFLATRCGRSHAEALLDRYHRADHDELGRTVWLKREPVPAPTGRGTILVVNAGTSDLPVAREAMVVAQALGNRVETLSDVGVAGIHRILSQTGLLKKASVVIVVAGMDGALASVVGGMVAVPVVAVPTSIGYGASFGGLSALLAMLNSCASGVTVVNIDNGFGAAAAASRINHIP